MTNLSPGKQALGSKWIYRIKYKSDSSIEYYKARVVVLGNTQQEGIEYTEIFTPVAKMVTIQTLLSVASIGIGKSIK